MDCLGICDFKFGRNLYYNDFMDNPFPGMNPYLEHPALWQDVYARLIAAIADELSEKLTLNYFIGVESRAYIAKSDETTYIGRPDVAIMSPIGTISGSASPVRAVEVAEVALPMEEEIALRHLEIREAGTHTLVTEIELLSPVNKVNKRGRATYIKKRNEYFQSSASLIEIDLLRIGDPMPFGVPIKVSDYRILISPSWKRPQAQLLSFSIRVPIPDIAVPLMQHEEQPNIELNQLLQNLFARGRFAMRVDYSQASVPPLDEEDAEWSETFIRSVQ